MKEESVNLSALQAGDENALKQLIQRYHLTMWALAAMIAGENQADDVMQEVWLKVIKALKNFKGKSSLKTWLYRIVSNCAISFLRKNKRENLTLEGDLNESKNYLDEHFSADGHWNVDGFSALDKGLEHVLQADELSLIIQKAMDKLPKVQRCVFVMKTIELFTDGEICNKLNITESNLRVLLHRAKLTILGQIELYERED